MLDARQAWETIREHAPRSQWLQIPDLYALIEAHVALDDQDRQPETTEFSTTWQRTVRDAINDAKRRGELDFVARLGIRIRPPSSPRS